MSAVAGERGPRVRMCRGCCCGTRRKHRDVDHDAIALALGEGLGDDAELLTVDCLWACDLSNVVVVNPSTTARSGGARPAWVREVNTVERARELAAWVRRGGPGVVPPPAALGEVHTAAGLRRVSNAGW
ncbi:hypothetical protein BJ993_002923 [Nocardioides aromaticivorans]|uniref:(2Fe-2S) ferredoxin domain-containing protein n=1 Tax=Nocardioides aromaticivorans TaxID=200618 RepID=A0A7Y9ZK60_9ACTN|nr:hypothetical protein [Nocardioides aromaticivorans]NYI45843.1 hypothetical protein [Nocardioides aromaticivorans]